MKNAKRFLLLISLLIIAIDVFAAPPQKRMFEGLLVESGTSTENIMPLLANIAGRQQGYFKRKGYFKRIYGQYRGGYILIIIDSNGKIDTATELEDIAHQVVNNVMGAYPSSEGRLEINSSPPDPWDSMVVKFEKGKITNSEITPSKEDIAKRIQIQKIRPSKSANEKLIFDINTGEFSTVKIGSSMTPELIIEKMGKQPEDTGNNVYSYYNDGIAFAISKKDENYYCSGLSIYLKDTKQEELFGNRVWFYKAFKGKVSPLTKRDNMQTIKKKLGNPDDFMEESFDGSPRFTYRKNYGTVYIFFNKRTKTVEQIDIYSK